MTPVSAILLIFGYGLGLPVLFRLGSVVRTGNRLAFGAHQLGISIATLAWLARGGYLIGTAHVIWLIGARIWYERERRRQLRSA